MGTMHKEPVTNVSSDATEPQVARRSAQPASQQITLAPQPTRLIDNVPKADAVPAKTVQRLDFLDATRAIAIIGMLLTHILMFANVPESVEFVASGRASIMFAILAGISAVLMTRSVSRRAGLSDLNVVTRAGQMTIVKRALALLVLGLFLGAVSFGPIVILTTYAILLLLAALVLKIQRTSVLAALTAITAVGTPLISWWIRRNFEPNPDHVISDFMPSVTDLTSMNGILGSMRAILLDGFYPVLTWIPFMLAGIVLGRLLTAAKPRLGAIFSVGAVLAVISYGTSLFVRFGTSYNADAQARFDQYRASTADNPHLAGEVPEYSWMMTGEGKTRLDDIRNLLVAIPHSGSITEILGGIGLTAMLLVAMAMLWRVAGKYLAPLAKLGRAALTYYVGHIIVLDVFVVLYAMDIDTHVGLIPMLLLLVVLPLIIAHFWFKKFKRGPLEWGMHKIAYLGTK